MLVLSRKQNEELIITVPPSETSTEVRVMLCEIVHKGRVRIGIQAPREVHVVRAELRHEETSK